MGGGYNAAKGLISREITATLMVDYENKHFNKPISKPFQTYFLSMENEIGSHLFWINLEKDLE